MSQIYFWNRTLHVSESFFVNQQESSTVYTAIGVCHTGYDDCLLASSQHSIDNGQRNFPKHLEFYSKNKFEKLVHPVGFIIRIYHEARSSECQILQKFVLKETMIAV
jgi:thiaminase